jgi:hypothetical protein
MNKPQKKQEIKRPRPDPAALKALREAEYAKIPRRVSKAKELEKRDFDIFRRVAKGHVMSLEQARAVFWVKKDGQLAALTTAQYRLNQLVGAGLLGTEYTNCRKAGEQVYYLTQEGLSKLTPLEHTNALIGMPNYKEIKQQLDAQDAWTRLEKHLATRGERLLHWKSEREIRSEALKERSHQDYEAAMKKAGGHYKNLKQYQAKTKSDAGFISVNVADAQAVIERGDGTVYSVDIEIDGQYYGKMLSDKIGQMAELAGKSNSAVIWATSRGDRIRQEVAGAGVGNRVIVMDI